MPSAVQSVATQVVFDYLLDSQGRPLPNRAVAVTLDYSFATNANPVVFVMPVTATAVTDNNGYWQISLVPNANINPSGTVYSVEAAGQAQYQISVPAVGGPFQSSAIVANATVTLSPASTGLTGPITVTGNETVTGNLNVQGSTTLAGTQVQGDLTIASAFRLLFLAAVSKLVPGSTSFSIRNNADSADNLLVTDAGGATVRNGLTVTAGDAVVTAGRLLLNAAAAKVLGGATSLSFRNNADSADNLLLTDAGLVTLRNALTIPPVAGGTAVTANYGTTPVKIYDPGPIGSAQSSIDIQNIPSGFRELEIYFCFITDQAGAQFVVVRMNNDSGANNYSWANVSYGASPGANAVFSASSTGDTSGRFANATTNFCKGKATITDYASTTAWKQWTTLTTEDGPTINGGTYTGSWKNSSIATVNRLTFFAVAGNLKAGSYVRIMGVP